MIRQEKKYDFVFPIVAFSEGTMVFVMSLEELLICSNLTYKTDFYTKLPIIDSAGKNYLIEEACKLRTVFSFKNLNIFNLLKVEVELEISEVTNSDLDDLKATIFNVIEEDQEFWNRDRKLDEKLEFVKKTSTHFELLDYLVKSFKYLNERL